jgi:hypothetical protein
VIAPELLYHHPTDAAQTLKTGSHSLSLSAASNLTSACLKWSVHPPPQPSKSECDDDCGIALTLNCVPDGVQKGIGCRVGYSGVRQIAGNACDPLLSRTVLCHALASFYLPSDHSARFSDGGN